MRNTSRLEKTLSFQKSDRLPVIEWAAWWDKTINRWREEGLPDNILEGSDIMNFFGLDVHKQFWIQPRGSTCPQPFAHGAGLLENPTFRDYSELKEQLFPKNSINKQEVKEWAEKQKNGEAVIWLTLEGFFWFPRTILGIENHLYSFCDEPQLMHTLNEDVLNFNIRTLEEFCEICNPNFMTFAEDMSYNKGPMLSKALFDEFIAPYYKKILHIINKYKIDVFIDTDGNIKELIPWFKEIGIHGFLPLERQSGVDINELRVKFPELKMIGGFDKLIMHKGEEAMRLEFERILPVMKQGGYIPSCDHQTPPDVSLDNYKTYVSLLKEYCYKAMS